MKRKKVIVCAHIGEGCQLLNGQTIKSKYVISALKNKYGADTIGVVDTHDFQRRIFRTLISVIRGVRGSRNFVILPASRGLRVFAPVVSIVSLKHSCRIHYIVIGGWLPEFLRVHKWLLRYLRTFHGIYVETESMVKKLNKLGLKNAFLLRNFKNVHMSAAKEKGTIPEKSSTYKFCTFSRVMPEKGIEITCDAVEKVSEIRGREYISLDIYGQIESGYEKKFRSVINRCGSNIRYMGSIQDKESADTLKDYDALIFQTYYDGEGVPGTIIDAFYAGIPVIASDWNFNSEIITDGENGVIIRDKRHLFDFLLNMDQNINGLKKMKGKCLLESRKYTEKEFLKIFCRHLA